MGRTENISLVQTIGGNDYTIPSAFRLDRIFTGSCSCILVIRRLAEVGSSMTLIVLFSTDGSTTSWMCSCCVPSDA